MKKRGFTLVELLAVIIILAVIALIATPLVLNVVDSAKKSAWESSAYGIMEAVKMNSMDEVLSGELMEATYYFPTNEIVIQGSQPEGGEARISKDGKIELAIHNGKWCAVKNKDDEEIKLVEYVEGECELGMEIIGDVAEKYDPTPIIPEISDATVTDTVTCEEGATDCTEGTTTTDSTDDIRTVIVPAKYTAGAKEVVEFTIYTVGYVTNPERTGTNYTFNIKGLPIDLENYSLLVTSSGLMTTQEDFDNYVKMKATGKPDTELVNPNPGNSAVVTAEELYTYRMTSNELTLNSVEVQCTKELCQATIDETFANLAEREFHETTTQNGNPLNALYNGVKFTVTVVKRIAMNDASNPFGTYKYMGMIETTNFKIVHETAEGKLYHTGETEDVIVPSVVTGKPYHAVVDLEKCIGDDDSDDSVLACVFLLIGVVYGPSSQLNQPDFAADLEAIGISFGDGYLKVKAKLNSNGCRALLKEEGATNEYISEFCTQENIDEMFAEIDYIQNMDSLLLADAYGLIYLNEYMSYETESYPITTLTKDNFTWGGDINSITISSSIESIEEETFYNKNLTSVDFSNAKNLQYIGEEAFKSNDIVTLDLSGATKLKSLGTSSFYRNALTSVIIPNSVSSIASNAFSSNSTLTSITIDNSEGSIPYSPWGATNATITYLR